MYKFLVLSALCAVALSAPQYGQSEGHHEDYYTEPHYAFEYSVNDPHTGDYHSQKEERKGDSTKGEYSLVEADGSKRLVQYYVEGKSGFLAEVQKGEGGYAKPSYSKPSYSGPSYSKPSYSEPSYSRPSYFKEQAAYKSGYEQASAYKYSKPSYSQSSYSSSSSYKSAPSYYKPSAPSSYSAPSYYEPAPAYKPAPSYYKPAPSYNEPAYKPSYNPAPAYKPSYSPAPAYNPSYSSAPAYSPSYSGNGAATSSVSFSTRGAKITTSTKHIIPPKNEYKS